MSNKYELTGNIIAILETQTFGSGFQKREFVVEEVEGKYPQQIKFEVVKDKCDSLNGYGLGQQVNVAFNVRGNEHNGKYYVSLQAWKIEKMGTDLGATSPEYGQRDIHQNGAPPPSTTATADSLDDFREDDDIPF